MVRSPGFELGPGATRQPTILYKLFIELRATGPNTDLECELNISNGLGLMVSQRQHPSRRTVIR